MKTKNRTQRLVISAMLIALGTALSLVKIGLPFGGSITLAAMVPLVTISLLYGLGWGAVCCCVYGALQLVLGLNNFSYVTTVGAIIAVVLFDYIVAYGVMSLSALAKGIKKPAARAVVGSVIGCALRFLCHFITGVYVWGQWAEADALPQFVQGTALSAGKMLVYSYSFFYNLAYMLPETIITAIAAAVVIGVVEKITGSTAAPAVEEAASAAEGTDPAFEETVGAAAEAAPAVEEEAPVIEEAADAAVGEAADAAAEEAVDTAVEEAADAAVEEAADVAVGEAADTAVEEAADAAKEAVDAADAVAEKAAGDITE